MRLETAPMAGTILEGWIGRAGRRRAVTLEPGVGLSIRSLCGTLLPEPNVGEA